MLPLLSILVNFAGNSTAEVLLLELGPGAAVLVRGVSIDQATCLCVDREAAASFGAICLQTYTGCTAGRTESTTKGLCSSAAAVQQCRRLMRRAAVEQSKRSRSLECCGSLRACNRRTNVWQCVRQEWTCRKSMQAGRAKRRRCAQAATAETAIITRVSLGRLLLLSASSKTDA